MRDTNTTSCCGVCTNVTVKYLIVTTVVFPLSQLSGFGLSVLPDIDPNPDNFVCAGIINASSTRVGCLLRLEPNREIKVGWRVHDTEK